MHPKHAIACAALTLGAAAPLSAQATVPPEPTKHSIWLVYSGDHPFASRLGLVFDTQLRLVQTGDHERQLLVRPGLSFALDRHAKLSAGYAVSGSHAEVDDPLVSRRPEHRLWVSAQLSHQVGRIAFAHRYRMEHRWLSDIDVDDAGAPIGESWVTAERMRYSLRASVPLSTRGRAHGIYVAASDELFASFGGDAGSIALDQNRAAFALGMRVAPPVRIEVGYMLQSSADDNGRLTERNHTIQIGVTSTAALRH